MRLLYVCSDFGIKPDGVKGASIHLRSITRALSESGHDVRLLSPHGGPESTHPATPLLTPGCRPVEEMARMLKDWMTQQGYGDSVAKELRPLVYNAYIRDRACDAAATFKPHVVIERLALFGHVGLELAGCLGVPLVVEVNAILSEEAARYRTLELQRLAEEMEKRVLTAAHAVVAVSARLAEQLIALGVEQSRVHVVPNGVDLASFDAAPSRETCRAALGLNGEFVVGFAGSLKAWHGVDDLLSAFNELNRRDPNTRLLIVGAGPMESELKNAAAGMGVRDAVIFTGAVPHDRVPYYLRAMDVAVAPFKRQDNFYFSPIKLFEYMASGACVVASRLGQISELIEDEGCGLLCRPDDPSDLLDKLQRARKSIELRERLAARALQVVRRNYTWNHAAEKLSGILRGLVASRFGSAHAGRDMPSRFVGPSLVEAEVTL